VLKSLLSRLEAAIRRTPTYSVWLAFFVGSFGVVGLCLAALGLGLTMYGHISALGFTAAASLYRTTWLLFLPIGLLIGLAAGLILGLCLPIVEAYQGFARSHPRFPSRLPLVVAVVALIVLGGRMLTREATTVAVERYRFLAGSDGQDQAAANQALARQREALSALSQNAGAVLDSLMTTDAQLHQAQADLKRNLASLEAQKHSLDSTKTTLDTLAARERVLRAQIVTIETALGGARLITREDFDRSQVTSGFIGAVIGVITSVIGSYLFSLGRRSRRSRKHESEGAIL